MKAVAEGLAVDRDSHPRGAEKVGNQVETDPVMQPCAARYSVQHGFRDVGSDRYFFSASVSARLVIAVATAPFLAVTAQAMTYVQFDGMAAQDRQDYLNVNDCYS